MNPLAILFQRAAAPLLVAMVVVGQVQAQTAPAGGVIELNEAVANLQLSANIIADLETRLARAKQQVNALSESLAVANRDTQENREAYEKLRVQMEGLGIAALDGSNAELQQRLLTALSDLRISEAQKRAASEELKKLVDTARAYASAGTDSQQEARLKLDESLASAEATLNQSTAIGSAAGADLQSAKVVSLKDDLGIAILNVGSRHGVHPGMPFALYRQDKPIARVLVVDVRNGICGAVIQELVNKADPVKIGDTGKVEAMKG